ncbi:Alpha-galactosidase [Klebsiella pneumoniae IS10]|nr:Alpha-galactosidase [Klebsiella pneumoniae IS10]CDK73925.1 Alpha-galactosidase [Klebsiella pneumoniae IS22]CDK91952.1 Alpha-galactosidase [Klebsiella pneumoniae IS33]CDL57471.1 Alpha-galactosidase [Klebsiella pneumoniae]
MSAPKITFIGAGSTVFVKNILGDVFQRPALKSAHIALMDIDETRLEESHIVVRKLMDSVGANGEISCHRDRKTALQGADFVVVAFQIGGYEPVPSPILQSASATAWSRPLPIRWGREALCARCAPSRTCGLSATI